MAGAPSVVGWLRNRTNVVAGSHDVRLDDVIKEGGSPSAKVCGEEKETKEQPNGVPENLLAKMCPW